MDQQKIESLLARLSDSQTQSDSKNSKAVTKLEFSSTQNNKNNNNNNNNSNPYQFSDLESLQNLQLIQNLHNIFNQKSDNMMDLLKLITGSSSNSFPKNQHDGMNEILKILLDRNGTVNNTNGNDGIGSKRKMELDYPKIDAKKINLHNNNVDNPTNNFRSIMNLANNNYTNTQRSELLFQFVFFKEILLFINLVILIDIIHIDS